MGKNIKSYATIPCPFPREREGSLTAKVLKFFVLNMVRLNRTHYSHLKFTNKIFQFSKLSHKVNSSKVCRFRAVRPHSPRITRNSHILLTYYVPGTCPGKEPCRIPANYANSVQSAHTVRE